MEHTKWEEELPARAEKDVRYQLWLRQLRQLEPAYQKLRGDMSSDQLALLDTYISTCEEMDHALTCLAYELGFSHGRRASFTRI